MTDPPRHTYRGRPMVCPGSCNPLRARHQHHHHHHHRHCRQKYVDATSIATSTKNISFVTDEFTSVLLKSLKSDTPVTSTISTDDESISRTSSFARIALIKVSSSPKTPRPEETDIPAIVRKILSQKKLETTGEPSTSESPVLRKIDSIVPTRPVFLPKERIVGIAGYRVPRTLRDVKCIVTRRLNGLISKVMSSSLFLYLVIFVIYAGIHVLMAVLMWRTSAYQFFVSSQICGIFVFLMWRITGTILI